MKNIILIGLVGAGKSTVGQLLAEKLQYQFIDTDRLIEKNLSKNICDIWTEFGEDGFRKIEAQTIKDLQHNHSVVSTGGGAVCVATNRTRLGQMGYVVYLDVDLKAQLSRLAQCNDRPLLRNENRAETLQWLRSARQPLYEEIADFTINTTYKSPQEVTLDIIASLPIEG